MTAPPGLPDGSGSGFWAILAGKVATPASPAVIVSALAWIGVDTNFGSSKNATVQLVWLGAALVLSLITVYLGYRFLLQPVLPGQGALGAPGGAVPPELPQGPALPEYRAQVQAAERGH